MFGYFCTFSSQVFPKFGVSYLIRSISSISSIMVHGTSGCSRYSSHWKLDGHSSGLKVQRFLFQMHEKFWIQGNFWLSKQISKSELRESSNVSGVGRWKRYDYKWSQLARDKLVVVTSSEEYFIATTDLRIYLWKGQCYCAINISYLRRNYFAFITIYENGI